jgi:dsRNA-specific ribonuclease
MAKLKLKSRLQSPENRDPLRKFRFRLLIKELLRRKWHLRILNATAVPDSSSLSSQWYFPSRLLISAVCLRIQPNRSISTRQKDIEAEEKFVDKATSKSVKDLLENPQRDVHSYDKKPSVRFSVPAIAALHARIGLPSGFPLSTLDRCLTDPSVERDHARHNEALSVIGSGLLEYYVSEYLCARWPRLPMKVQLAALWAYTGESALARIAREWGVQSYSMDKDGKDGKNEKDEKRGMKEFESDPALIVNAPKAAEKLDYDADINIAWEIREQARQGWLEQRGRYGTGKFLSTLDDKEYQKRFVLFALQRFIQAIVGGVYVHSVPPFPLSH